MKESKCHHPAVLEVHERTSNIVIHQKTWRFLLANRPCPCRAGKIVHQHGRLLTVRRWKEEFRIMALDLFYGIGSGER